MDDNAGKNIRPHSIFSVSFQLLCALVPPPLVRKIMDLTDQLRDMSNLNHLINNRLHFLVGWNDMPLYYKRIHFVE